ncbi:MAG TPA: UbiX family flavin prenyltransferase [Methanocorpusculum sp.]|nr:UbiX family flavin prenyltransferase [Methanocorpusculum sp.]
MKRIIVGVTGASGMLYAKQFLDALKGKAEVYVVLSDAGKKIAKLENVDLEKYPFTYKSNAKLEAEIASGSFLYDAMVVVPCSMKTLSAIAHGYADTLIVRAAEVTLKERRKLILVPRETPLSRVHLENMLKANDAGAVIMPASPPFYSKPQTISELVDMITARILDHCGIEHDIGKRWHP